MEHIVKGCKGLSLPFCKTHDKCKINFEESPSNEPGKCTHLNEVREDYDKVETCKTSTMSICQSYEYCHFNFDQAPSKKPGVCTHKEEARNTLYMV